MQKPWVKSQKKNNTEATVFLAKYLNKIENNPFLFFYIRGKNMKKMSRAMHTPLPRITTLAKHALRRLFTEIGLH
ncbi:MAG: hypothetical protein LBU09_03175, partial [Endomicrobium sp.]|jgi:uncharacterized Zn finger protein|nr:hypothetical protein [Endomicrobium sp.]